MKTEFVSRQLQAKITAKQVVNDLFLQGVQGRWPACTSPAQQCLVLPPRRHVLLSLEVSTLTIPTAPNAFLFFPLYGDQPLCREAL